MPSFYDHAVLLRALASFLNNYCAQKNILSWVRPKKLKILVSILACKISLEKPHRIRIGRRCLYAESQDYAMIFCELERLNDAR